MKNEEFHFRNLSDWKKCWIQGSRRFEFTNCFHSNRISFLLDCCFLSVTRKKSLNCFDENKFEMSRKPSGIKRFFIQFADEAKGRKTKCQISLSLKFDLWLSTFDTISSPSLRSTLSSSGRIRERENIFKMHAYFVWRGKLETFIARNRLKLSLRLFSIWDNASKGKFV